MNLKEENEALRSALTSAILALDDWLTVFAPEFCREDRVNDARKRISEHGLMYYHAITVRKCKQALGEYKDDDN